MFFNLSIKIGPLKDKLSYKPVLIFNVNFFIDMFFESYLNNFYFLLANTHIKTYSI